MPSRSASPLEPASCQSSPRMWSTRCATGTGTHSANLQRGSVLVCRHSRGIIPGHAQGSYHVVAPVIVVGIAAFAAQSPSSILAQRRGRAVRKERNSRHLGTETARLRQAVRFSTARLEPGRMVGFGERWPVRAVQHHGTGAPSDRELAPSRPLSIPIPKASRPRLEAVSSPPLVTQPTVAIVYQDVRLAKSLSESPSFSEPASDGPSVRCSSPRSAQGRAAPSEMPTRSCRSWQTASDAV